MFNSLEYHQKKGARLYSMFSYSLCSIMVMINSVSQCMHASPQPKKAHTPLLVLYEYFSTLLIFFCSHLKRMAWVLLVLARCQRRVNYCLEQLLAMIIINYFSVLYALHGCLHVSLKSYEIIIMWLLIRASMPFHLVSFMNLHISFSLDTRRLNERAHSSTRLKHFFN